MLIDKYNRHLNYLRISVTDRCNLRCMYCMPRRFVPKLPHTDILTYEEILRIIRTGIGLGISKIRITGGEPLVRKGICNFLKQVTMLDGLTDISLTTNGVLLGNNIEKIRSAGIKRINISLDTMNRQTYKKITGFDCFDRVWEGIELAHNTGFDPVKINVVPLRGINDNELAEFAKLSFIYPFHIRFIECMPIGNQKSKIKNQKSNILAPEIMERISLLGKLNPVKNGKNDGPAERYKFDGATGEIGIIRPISHHFCYKCNRLRLTASGRLRACLLSDRQEDMKGPLRNGCSDKELEEIFLKAVQFKPFEHNVADDSVSGQMSAIGG